MKLSCVICSRGLLEREQRVDEMECKVSSLSTVTASCVQLRRADVQRRTGEYTLKLGELQLDSFTRLSKRNGEQERAISPRPDCRGERPIRSQSEPLYQGRKNKRKSYVQTYGTQFIRGVAWAAKVPLKKIMTSRLFEHGGSFTSWISCGSSLNIYLDANKVPSVIHLMTDGCSQVLTQRKEVR